MTTRIELGDATATATLPEPLLGAWRRAAREWDETDKTRRLWRGDVELWTGGDEDRWLGWLELPRQVAEIEGFARELVREGLSQALLLGMGGSSLGAELLVGILDRRQGFLDLEVLDSTDPETIRAAQSRLDLAHTFVLAASKSGGTLETSLLLSYFRQQLGLTVDSAEALLGVITDPDSRLDRQARRDGFRRIFYGRPDIGGRFSVLSPFGLVPAALAGVDVSLVLEAARAMASACAPGDTAGDNPGVALGLLLGVATLAGRDKLTLLPSSALEPLGPWLEQLLAESLGKAGTGIIPVDGEPIGAPEVYGADRLFVVLRLSADDDSSGAPPSVATLAAAGQPVIEIGLEDRSQLGAEILRWQVATAVAGSLLAVDPFGQPDVEAAKVAARELSARIERDGALPTGSPCVEGEGLQLFTGSETCTPEPSGEDSGSAVAACLRDHLRRLQPGDYFAVLAYLPATLAIRRALDRMRLAVRDRCGVATTVGFGPRYLHSTGQAHKGGGNRGLFLEITRDPVRDLEIPDHGLSFGQVQSAQALGDAEVLWQRGRRLLRVHLTGEVEAGLAALDRALRSVLESLPARGRHRQ